MRYNDNEKREIDMAECVYVGGVGMTAPTPPLAGTVVVSVGHSLPGLYCIALLRDLGAQVIRVERVQRDGDGDPYAGLDATFPVRSLTAGTSVVNLDLKHEQGREILYRLTAKADVVLEGFRPGAAARLGVDYARLSTDHAALVYASISGYGQTGSMSQRPGHDVNYLAETGALHLGNPIGLPGIPFADGLAGVSAALNVVAAVHAASHGGQGQYLDLAIVDGPLFMMATEFEHFWRTGAARHAGDTHLTGRYPWYNVHATAEGGAIAVGAVEPGFHAAWRRGIGSTESVAAQHAGGDALETAWQAARDRLAGCTRDEAVALFAGEYACVSPVLDTSEVAQSPLMARVQIPGTREGEVLVRSPVATTPVEWGAELSGGALLERFGFDLAEIAQLRRADVLGDDNGGNSR
jgi:alpha-methylacyl-CoA racemase